MKIFTNLPGNLRVLFGALRILSVLLGAFWLLMLSFGSRIPKQFAGETKLMVSVGEVVLQAGPAAVALNSDSAKPGSLGLNFLRGNLQVDLCSPDAGLVSALRWTVIPAALVLIVFSWVLFSSLRTVCGNIERGEVFNENNLRLVRGIGMTLMAYSLVSAVAGFWAAHVMGSYLVQHVSVAGLPAGAGALGFLMPAGLLTVPGGLVIGGLVLVVSEAFRQGLTLKTESDLTV